MKLTAEEKKLRSSNGPIYIVTDTVVRNVIYISPVEWKKKAIKKLFPKTEARQAANWAIDSFIFLKWLFIYVIWTTATNHWLAVTGAVFLLIMNLHTYFWYHLWAVDNNPVSKGSELRERRRFVNVILALAYSVMIYGYLYHRVINNGFEWPQNYNVPDWVTSLIFSFGNALTGYSGDLKPISMLAQITTSSQLLMTFIFVAMLLNNSIPNPKD